MREKYLQQVSYSVSFYVEPFVAQLLKIMLKRIFSFRLLSFLLALVIGICFVSIPLKSSWFHQEEPRFYGVNPALKFFTLAEGKTKLRREVRYAKPTAYQNTGRVVMLDMVSTDKFFAVVYWDATPEDGKPGVRHYSKDGYEKLVKEE